MGRILLALLLLTINSFSSELVKFEEDPFDTAFKELSSKKIQNGIMRAIKYYQEDIYSKSVDTCKELLKTDNINQQSKELIYLILSSNFYKLKEEESMIGLLRTIEPKKIQNRYILYRIYQLASILFTERKNEDGIKLLNHTIYSRGKDIPDLDILFENLDNDVVFKFYPSKNEKINYKGTGFELNKNIFPFDPSKRVFGDIFLYVVEKDSSLLEISKNFDFGYYELKNANPFIDPFDVRKGQILILPYRRIFPFEKFEYGTIYINIVEKRLYYPVMINGISYIITFPIGIGTDEAQSPIGEFKISEKRKDPAWYPPASIRKEQPDLPEVFPPGPDNPLGTRAMRLGGTSFLMHGTNKEYGIGMRVSHGCIRMYNHDVEKLFEIVGIGTKIVSGEIYIKNTNEEVELFDESGYKFLAPQKFSKIFTALMKTDIIGKSFSIKAF